MVVNYSFIFLPFPRPRRPTLFPYTTLFRSVQPDLLGRHRLDLEDLAGLALEREAGDDVSRLLGVAGPVDHSAGRSDGLLELLGHLRQVVGDLPFQGAAGAAQLLPVTDLEIGRAH